jgi:hypothetical protein
MPPEGYESSIHFSQEVYKFVFSLRLRKTVNNTGVEGLTRNQFRFDIQKEIAGFSLLYRLEMMEAISSQENSLGYLISQRLKTKLFMGKAELALSVFNIPNYDTRIYLYQAEVPGSFAVPFFYGNGFNFNLVYKTSILRNLAIAGRIAFTHYTWKPNSPAGETDQNFSFYFNYNFERKKEAS